MRRAKILVVDDSIVARRIVGDIIARDPSLELVGLAANGVAAVEQVQRLSPDLVVLDIEMPEMDGLAALAEIRRTHPRLPVVMFSSLTRDGAAATFEALALGASDYVAKPDAAGGREAAVARVEAELLPKIKALCARAIGFSPPPPPPSRPIAVPDSARGSSWSSRPGDVVAIGASTGGPNALAAIAGSLGAYPLPIVVAQHMPPMFTRMLAERLSAKPGVRAVEATDAAPLEPGTLFIAPGDHHLEVQREQGVARLRVHRDAPENFCRPSVDVLFRSVAAAYGRTAFAVVLTGMGRDGLRGAEAIRAAGGTVVVQDEQSSVVWGMPGAVARAGLAHAVVPLDQIASVLPRPAASGDARRAQT